MRADAGVVISASHNAYHYNGIKIFDRHGFKLPDSKEQEIEAAMHSPELDKYRPTMEFIGKATRIDDAIGRYIVLSRILSLRNRLSMAFGSCLIVLMARPISLGRRFSKSSGPKFLHPLHPNGENINDQCGAVYPQTMCKAVHEHRADIGISLDGDGDR